MLYIEVIITRALMVDGLSTGTTRIGDCLDAVAAGTMDESQMFTKESATLMRDLVTKGTFGFGVFECDTLLITYEELKAKGVEFTKPPTREFYAFEALFKDDSDNWFSLEEKGS